MRITVPHYFDFGPDRDLVGDDLVRPEAWDALRTRTDGPFGLATTREEWERVADERPDIRDRARAVHELLETRRVRRLGSYGVGGAPLECWLYRLDPERTLVLTEYAPETIERLRGVFPEADIRRHDFLTDAPLDVDLHLFHRIDTELTNSEWRRVFERFRGVPVLVVATEVATNRRILDVLKALPRHRRSGATRAGVIRNVAAFESLWRDTHSSTQLQLNDLEGWLLEPR